MTGGDIASTIIGALGLIGGIIGFFVSMNARNKAWEASDAATAAQERATRAAEDAAAALTRSSTAAEESAAALKRANDIAEASLPSVDPRWNLMQMSDSAWLIINESPGGGTARAVLLEGGGTAPALVIPEETAPRDLLAGEGIGFLARRALGSGRPVVKVSWDSGGKRLSRELTVYY